MTFVAGILAEGSLKKTLIGIGGTSSMVGIASALVASSKQSEDNYQSKIAPHQISELESREASIKKSVEEASAKMQVVEADINSLQTEQNQLLAIIADLNTQKQQLEAEHNSKQQELEAVNTDVLTLENRKQTLESDNDSLEKEIEELSNKHEQLTQVIAPIEESLIDAEVKSELEPTPQVSFIPETEVDQLVDEIDASELESFNDKLIASHDAPSPSVEEDINPFSSSSESSKFNDEEAGNDLELVDKLIGQFDESELSMFEQESSVSDEYPIDEELDTELEEESSDELPSDNLSEVVSESGLEELSLESDTTEDQFIAEAADSEMELSFEDPSLESEPEQAIASSNEEFTFETSD
ncbi:MAG: hypothetical protein AAFQ80_25410, partial [Cyanobacteria bacterium J06621_8]